MWANSSLSVYYFFFGDFESVQKAVALSTIFQGAKIMQIERKTKFIWIFLRCSLSSRQVSKIVQIFHASKYLRLFLLWTHCFYFVKGFDTMLILRLYVHFYLLPIAGFGIILFIILSMKSAGNVGALAYWRRNASRRSKSLNVVMLLACRF